MYPFDPQRGQSIDVIDGGPRGDFDMRPPAQDGQCCASGLQRPWPSTHGCAAKAGGRLPLICDAAAKAASVND